MALTVLSSSLVAIGQLAFVARRHAEKARALTLAQTLCQTKLAEIAAGCLPLESVSDEPIEELPDWTYSVNLQSTEVGDLVAIHVTVRPSDDRSSRSVSTRSQTGQATAASAAAGGATSVVKAHLRGGVEFTLSTWLRPPPTYPSGISAGSGHASR